MSISPSTLLALQKTGEGLYTARQAFAQEVQSNAGRVVGSHQMHAVTNHISKVRGAVFFGDFSCGIFAGLDFGLITRLAQLVQVWRRLCARAMVELQYEFLRRTDLFLVWCGTGREAEAKGRGANESDEQVFHNELVGQENRTCDSARHTAAG